MRTPTMDLSAPNTPMQPPMDQIMQLPTMQQSMHPFMQPPTLQLSMQPLMQPSMQPPTMQLLMQFTPKIYQSFTILWQHGGSMLQWRMAPCVTANFYKNLSLRKIILSLQQKWICEGCCGDKILFLRQTFVNNLLVHTKLFVAQCVVQIVEATQLFLDRV